MILYNNITFTLNGEKTTWSGSPAARLLDALRYDFENTGVKCGCGEGECGACAVILDGKLINSCTTAMGRVAGSEVLTIEGYKKTERFTALDKAFASTGAVQCGFCTPGMVMAAECILSENPHPSETEIRVGISGNLCRCTGYNAIVKAIETASKEGVGLWSGSDRAVFSPAPREDKNTRSPESTEAIDTPLSFIPANLAEALSIRSVYDVIPHCGGTDLMIDGKKETRYLFLHKVPEMREIKQDGEYIRIGASCTFTEVADNALCPPILREAIEQIAAPAIRNLGTIGGNLGNGSPKADSALIFFVTDSKLRLKSASSERILPVKDYYLGRNKTALKPDELITEVLMPAEKANSRYYYRKVGAREALAISRISFAGLFGESDGVITNFAAAFGAVSDVIIRRNDIDAILIGKTLEEAKRMKADYLNAYETAIVPIRGRVSEIYRKKVCMNILNDFLETMGI